MTIAINPVPAPQSSDLEPGLASRHRVGMPPSVRPTKMLYMIQRRRITSSLTGPANSRIPVAAAADITRSSSNDRRSSRKRVIVETASMKSSYTPAARSIVPPLIPGTRFASPISAPPSAARGRWLVTLGSGPAGGAVPEVSESVITL